MLTLGYPLKKSTSFQDKYRNICNIDCFFKILFDFRKAVADSLPQKKVLCTTPLTPQGNHRYVIQTADTHHSYFASPRIDLKPRFDHFNFQVVSNYCSKLRFDCFCSPSGHTNNLETNKSAAGVLRFFHRKKLAGRLIP